MIERRNKVIKINPDNNKEVERLTAENANILSEETKSKAYKFRKYCDKDNTLNVTEM